MRPWIALFSQTGSELKAICDYFNAWPTEIITNNFNEDQWADINIPHDKVTIMNHNAIHNGLRFTKQRCFVTLHGYLKIIPKDITEQHDIYNGHPAAIHLYPELKGKDPQEKTWNNISKYNTIGSVIHRVTEGVDEGEVVHSVLKENTCKSKDDVYNTLRKSSLQSWIEFLPEYINVRDY